MIFIMMTIQASIPDDLQGQLQAIAMQKGVSVAQVVEETLRNALMPTPFSNRAQLEDELDALQADVLSDYPWSE